MCSPRTIGGNTRSHSRSSFETIAGGTLAREKSSMFLSRDGAQQAMPNDDDALLPHCASAYPLRRPHRVDNRNLPVFVQPK